MSHNAQIELLENRNLFSISGLSFLGPLKISSKYGYDVYANGVLDATQAEEVVGPSTFDGNSCTRIKSTYTGVPTPNTSTLNQYIAVSNKDGLIVYGIVHSATVGSESTTITTTYVPEEIDIPAAMNPGVYYKSVYTGNTTTVINPGDHSSTMSVTVTDHIKLESGTLVPVTENGTVYPSYKVIVKSTTTSGTQVIQDWFDPSVGLIKSVSPDGSIVITSYHA